MTNGSGGNGDKPWWEEEGDYFDTWTLVHTGFGFIMGIICNALGFSIYTGFFITLVLATAWEKIEPKLYEEFVKLFPSLELPKEFTEKNTNSLVDIIVALIGFMLAKLLDSLMDMLATGEWAPDLTLSAPEPLALAKLAAMTFVFYFLIVIPTRLAIQARINKKVDELNKKMDESNRSEEF